MNLSHWNLWRVAVGSERKRRLAHLMADNEALVQKCATVFLSNTNYYIGDLREDILQAARIGLMRTLDKWEPAKGAFSTLAYFEMRHEMQLVIKHATPISRPKSADLPRRVQDAVGRFAALNGREPLPEEVGVTASAVARARAAQAHFVPLSRADAEAVMVDAPDYAGTLDDERDMTALMSFLKKLTDEERAAVLDDNDPDLLTAAKLYVERRRGLR